MEGKGTVENQFQVRLKQFVLKYKAILFFALFSIVCFIVANQFRAANGGEFVASVNYSRMIGYLSIGLFLFMLGIKLKKFIIYNLAMFWVLIMLVEIVFYALLGSPLRENKAFELPYTDESQVEYKLGYVPFADSIYEDILIVDGDTSFHVNYSIDSYNKRTTPLLSDTADKYALFFGCSIGFGYGLEDNQTIPYFYQEKENYRSYNFAHNGYGTNQMLARLQTNDIAEQVLEKDGEAYYLFFWDHIYRSIGTMKRHTAWVHKSPYYYFEDGKLTRNKTMKDGRPFTAWLYEALYQSSTLNYFEIDFPLKLNEEHYDLVVEMVVQSKKEYEKKFGNDQFCFVVMPTYNDYPADDMDKFLDKIEKKGIEIINLSNLVDYGPKYTLKNDAHPNSILAKMVANELINSK